jgi:hypothetical protein
MEDYPAASSAATVRRTLLVNFGHYGFPAYIWADLDIQPELKSDCADVVPLLTPLCTEAFISSHFSSGISHAVRKPSQWQAAAFNAEKNVFMST